MNEEIEIEEYAPWWIVIITLVGGLLRVFMLGTKGMWLDETFAAPLLGGTVGILLLWSPWIVTFIRQASAVYQGFWIPEPTWGAVIEVLKSFLNPSALTNCPGPGHFRVSSMRY